MDEKDDRRAARVAFIAALGGPVRVARELGIPNHSRVCNWYAKGFPHDQKGPLLALAKAREAEGYEVVVPAELHEDKKTWKWKDQEKTPLNSFLNRIAVAYGGNDEFAAASGIPVASIMSMRKTHFGLMAMHVPAIEGAAVDVGVMLPEWWGDAREKHAAYVVEQERRQALKKHLDLDDEAAP